MGDRQALYKSNYLYSSMQNPLPKIGNVAKPSWDIKKIPLSSHWCCLLPLATVQTFLPPLGPGPSRHTFNTICSSCTFSLLWYIHLYLLPSTPKQTGLFYKLPLFALRSTLSKCYSFKTSINSNLSHLRECLNFTLRIFQSLLKQVHS